MQDAGKMCPKVASECIIYQQQYVGSLFVVHTSVA